MKEGRKDFIILLSRGQRLDQFLVKSCSGLSTVGGGCFSKPFCVFLK